MRSIFCKMLFVPAIVTAAALVGPQASAEAVTVPFSFRAVGQNFPAGTYFVERSENQCFVTLSQRDSNKAMTWILGDGDPAPTDTRVRLMFKNADGHHVLDAIQYGSKTTPSLSKVDRHDRRRSPAPMNGQ